MVSGHQRRNRKNTIVIPLENGNQGTADQWTKVLYNIYRHDNIYNTISEAFHHGACISGMNLLHVYVDWKNDPVSGDIKVENLAFNEYFIDPYFKKLDLSDCSFVWRRSYQTYAQVAALLPDKFFDEIMALPSNLSGTSRDARFQYLPETYGESLKNKLAYDEYYYRDYRMQKLLVDKKTGETLDVSYQDKVDLELFLSMNSQVELIEQRIPTVRLAISVQDKVFYDGPQPMLIDELPFVPVVGYYNPMMPYFYSRLQGICSSLRDPQLLLNRRIILSAKLLESQVNSGYIFKENAIVDVKHLFQTGEGRIIPLKASAQMTDIQQIQPPQIPPSFFQQQETYSKELSMVSGVNEELLGASIDTKVGMIAVLKQGAALTTLQPLFDQLDNAMNILGNIIMSVVMANFTPGKIKNILGGAEPSPHFYKKSFGRYGAAIVAGMETESQRQLQLAQLMELRQMGIAIPDQAIIQAATIQNKEELVSMMAQQAQAQQQQAQAEHQSMLQEQEARIGLANARSFADTGLGAERLSRIEENKQLALERHTEALQNQEDALLSRAKAIKELESIDIAQLETLVKIAKVMKDTDE